MKKTTKIAISAFLILTMTASITACQQTAQNEGENTKTTVPETHQATENTTASVSDTESNGTNPEETDERELNYNPDKHSELCTTEIKAGGEVYEIKTYLYDRINETTGEIRGDVAFGLYKDSNLINTVAPIIGYIGQVGKNYDKDKFGEYFKVIKLEGGEVFMIAYPEDSGLTTTVFLTVKDGKLVTMERYYTDEEKEQLEKDGPHSHPQTEKYCFNTPGKYTVDKNSIVYKLEKEITMADDSKYAAGEISLSFDFEKNIVKCEKDEYAGMIYFK